LTDGTVTDACGISYVLESKDANEIVWFEPDHNGITAGTSGGEWLIQASTLSDPITPTSIQAKRVTKYCCANIEPRRTGISLTFVQKYRRRLMELLSDVFTNRYIAPHLNETAKHLSKDGIAELGYQEELAPIIWARTGDLPATGLTTTSQTVNDCTFDPDFTNQLLTLSNGDLTVDGTTTPPTVCALGIAIDFDAKKLWIYSPFYGGWNAQSLETQDPNTPVGGMTFTTTGTLFPMVYPGNASGTQNHVYTANFGATSFVHPIPTGYTAWGSGTTWNPSDKAANVTLSGGNLTAADLVANTNAGVRATTGKSTGKFYFEIAIVQVATWYTAIGFGTTAETLLDFPGRTGAGVHGFSVTCAAPPYGGGTYGLGGSIVNWNFLLTTTNENGTRRIAMATLGHNSGKFYFEMTMDAMVNSVSYGVWPAIGFCNHFQRTGAAGFISDSAANHLLGGSGNSIGYEARIGSVYLAGAPVYNAGAYPVGSIIGVAVDLDNKLVWFWNPVTGKWNGGTLATQNPSTRTGGFDFSGLAGGPYYPAIETNLYGVNTQFTANFGGTPFSQTIPTDYTPWAVNVTTVTTHTGYTIPPGGLIGATYRRVSAMTTETPAFVGWHRHDLGHGRLLTSLSVGPTGDGTLDTVDLVTTDGTNYFVEDFTQVFDEEDDLTVSWFVDGALVPDSAYEDNTATGIRFTGLNYFIGQSPTVVAFGLDLGPFVVDANGTIFVPYGSGTPPSSFDFTAPGAGAYLFTSAYVASHLLTEVGRNGGVAYSGGFIPIAVGFPFVSQGQILRAIAPEQAGTRSGPAFAKIRRAHEVQALLRSTMGIQFGTDFGTSMQMASLKSVSGVTPDPTQLYSGLWRETVNSAYDFDAMLAWQIVRPYPASVVSIGAAEQAQDS
jgi:hypothetical protein